MSRSLFFLVTLLLTACGGPSSEEHAVAASCEWPAGVAAATDASVPGCIAKPTFEICEAGGNPSCTDACKSSEYALTCVGAAQPASAWSCAVIPIPTGSDVEYFCCPCR